MPGSLGIAGRVVERRALVEAIQGVVGGTPCAVFVHGEAGVGKTRLVSSVCDEAAEEGVVVLWGRCVRFGAVDAPYVPLIRALEGWVESADAEDVSRVLDAVPAARGLLPSLGGRSSDGAGRSLPVVDALMMAIASRAPTMLVVDDVQWADLASRDALGYLIAGFRSQRLAVFSTYRNESLGAGDPMHGWLADLRRLPSVSEVRLDRLNRDETQEQIAMLLGGLPHPQLVDAVLDRSGGNPYLSELLVSRLRLTDTELPAGLPVELTDALLAAWHRLSVSAREVMRMLAVAGRPMPVGDLRKVAEPAGIGTDTLTAALSEATNAGICVAQDPDLCWFRHPLLAEVLYGTFVPGEAAPVHSAWAKALESGSAAGLDDVRRVGDLALHYEAAGNPDACLAASLRAADLAGRIKAVREEAVHLRRALRLWPMVHHDGAGSIAGEIDLLQRVALATELVGDAETSFGAWSRALELVDERAEPLTASRILVRWSDTAVATDMQKLEPTAELRHAVKLCGSFPNSAEYAEALATLSQRQTWIYEIELARGNAEEAVRAAHRSGSSRALSLAYEARGFAYLATKRAERDTAEAMRYALLSDDPVRIAWARMARRNLLDAQGRLSECVEIGLLGFNDALDAGASSAAAALTPTSDLLMVGRMAEAADIVRTGLSLAAAPNARAGIRLEAAQLAVRQGNLSAADMHLQRAEELIPNIEEHPGLEAPQILAECLLAKRQPAKALALLSRTMMTETLAARERDADQMLLWAARAAADLTEDARDRRDPQQETTALASLDKLLQLRLDQTPPPFQATDPGDLVQPAIKALFIAEAARAGAATPTSRSTSTSTSALWKDAAHRCAAAGMRWDETVATVRLAQALVDEGATRAIVATPLRSAYRAAAKMGATTLRRQAEALATLAHIPLEEPATRPLDQPATPLRALTKREQEVLAHLVAGRTYAEIADALFISKKTVSVHVSNLLRKTGTSSRQDVSALALRLRQPATDDP